MNPVSKTAYYCCGVRMLDAESPKPLVGDNYAKLLLGEEGLAYWEEFKHFKAPNASNTARHHIIDNHVKKILAVQPGLTIILIGAGLDSRAFRLPAGAWVEIDEPAMIEYKNSILPADKCPNALERIAIDFETEKLSDKLAAYAGRQNVIFIIEGVLMYLRAAAKDELLETLTNLFPKHMIFCDLMKKSFFEKLGQPIHNKLKEHGSVFKDMQEDPAKIFIDRGYTKTSAISTMKTAIDVGLFRISRIMVFFFLRKYFMGYAVYSFSYDAAGRKKSALNA